MPKSPWNDLDFEKDLQEQFGLKLPRLLEEFERSLIKSIMESTGIPVSNSTKGKEVGVTPTKSNEFYLYYKEGSSDKVYNIWIETVGGNNDVVFEYGRRGSTLQRGKKIEATHRGKAEHILANIVDEKLAKGYKRAAGRGEVKEMRKAVPFTPAGVPMPATGGMAAAVAPPTRKSSMGPSVSPMLLNVIQESDIEFYINRANWMLQEKFDGIRMMLGYDGNEKVEAWNKKGQLIEPPEEFCSVLQSCFKGFAFIIDGEACGARYFVFDLLWLEGVDQRKMEAEERLVTLGMLMRSAKKQPIIMEAVTAYTKAEKLSMFNEAKRSGKEGVVVKDKAAPYQTGRPSSAGAALKCKFTASCTCIVTEQTKGKRSVQLGMLAPELGKDGKRSLYIVGNCTIPINHDVPVVGTLVEINYLYAYRGGSLYQPVYKGPRTDQTEPDNVTSLQYKDEERK
jgi:bifunctional non-homologous end joining protein LigD